MEGNGVKMIGYVLAVLVVVISIICLIIQKKKLKKKDISLCKYRKYYEVCINLLKTNENKIKLNEYLEGNRFEKVAIYGMGEVGKILYQILTNEKVNIVYVIDNNYKNGEIEVRKMDEKLDDVDVIIVTPIFDFDNIEIQLTKLVNCRIEPLDDILLECLFHHR